VSITKAVSEFIEKESVARKIIEPDELPAGDLPMYLMWHKGIIYLSSNDIDQVLSGDNYIVEKKQQNSLVPLMDFAYHTLLKLSDFLKSPQTSIVKIAKDVAISLTLQEEISLFYLMKFVVKETKEISLAELVMYNAMQVACAKTGKNMTAEEQVRLFECDCSVLSAIKTIIMNGETYNRFLEKFGESVKKVCGLRLDVNKNSRVVAGNLHGRVEILVVNTCPDDIIFAIKDRSANGYLPIKQGITTLPADDPRILQMGWVVYEEIGMMVKIGNIVQVTM
jgi:hypothetical protein